MQESEKMEFRAKLTQKINAMADAIGQVNAEGKNTHSNYNFVGYEQVNAIIRSLSPVHKINILPSIIDASETTFPNNSGKQVVRTTVKMSFLLTDTETGYCEERFSFGADQDTQGKSFGQAVTEAQKRFELKLFHISTKADADPDTKNTEVFEQQPWQQTPVQQQQQQPMQVAETDFSKAVKSWGCNPQKVFEAVWANASCNVTENQTCIEHLDEVQCNFVLNNREWFTQQCK